MKRIAFVKDQAVAEECPQNGNHRHQNKALHHGGQHILLPHQSAVEKRQARACHHQNQGRAHQHPGVIPGAAGIRHLLFKCGDASLNLWRGSRPDFLRSNGKAGLSQQTADQDQAHQNS